MDNAEGELPIQEPEAERTYSFREKQLRDFFVNEYLVDYNSEAAAIRIGYGKSFAREYGTRFLNETYVRREIQKREGIVDDVNEDKEVAKKRIMAGLKREANYYGPGSSQAARVAALSKLATLHEMDPAHKPPETDPNESMAGTFVIPGIASPEQWAKMAAEQQEALISGKSLMPAPPSIN